jgi:hypothetical protein
VETHERVFTWVLDRLAKEGLLVGKTVGIDATTLEANAAMRIVVRRDTGAGYEEFLKGLAKASGIKTPTREALARLDRRRKKKASNDDWTSPSDPDAKITKMKDGRTHLANKVDVETGAIVAVSCRSYSCRLQAPPADARRADRASLCPPVRNRGHATHPSPRSREHPETPAHLTRPASTLCRPCLGSLVRFTDSLVALPAA